jgi:hypothetical protein
MKSKTEPKMYLSLPCPLFTRKALYLSHKSRGTATNSDPLDSRRLPRRLQTHKISVRAESKITNMPASWIASLSYLSPDEGLGDQQIIRQRWNLPSDV